MLNKTITGQTLVDTPWYVVQTNPRQELLAATAIEIQLELPVYLPEVLEVRQGRRQRTPFFPCYLFVQALAPMLPVSNLNRLAGVAHLVMSGGQPQPLAATVITALAERVEALNAAGGLPRHRFSAGDPVRLTAGPLAGLEAVFVELLPAHERVRVLLQFMGRAQTVETNLVHLEPVKSHPPRRTRGRGRVIRNC